MEQLPTRAEDMFCYGVYTASHVINQSYAPHLARLGLTYPQYITLTLLWERDGQKVTELAKILRMNTNTLTPLLKRLEALGHIKRTQGDKDKRQIIVRLTPAGRALQDKAPDITACMVNNTSLDHAELNELQRLLKKLTNGLETARQK
ncbi:DNA-binding MarR family transcriptional regulator [Maritalea mobilis]|uniref:DNA-binding MarR family transcriptional regulator n=2 Tax=Maritalea mobilis TaxID=483324 RepID=A0A4R6VWT4_9HYPH|nr:DNA-binding MarR family transcriptional regulator [Maritalea mobilis]